MQTHPILLGTAGHIDHGKTSLVKALTGIDTDRLAVEKERGITTELGFAHLELGGRRLGLVDVPGHERFIKSMVAGAGGLDLVCLVIAADEGIMPQTREHLDICQLLGVRRGVIALTKRDLVDDEWLELVTSDVRAGLRGSFLEDAPIVPCSTVSGAGLDELRGVLAEAADALPARSEDGAFRLPVDRVFTIKGFGTVVTGTVISGAAATADDLVVTPRGRPAKVRGLQVHGDAAERVRAGMRCAINLAGVSTEDVARGDLLAHPDAIEPTHLLDARFRYLATSIAPLPRRSRVLLHHGTAQLLATLVLVDSDRLEPGDEGLVQLRLDAATPIAALPGDRFLCRGFVVQEHYGTTLGGGEVLRVHAPKVRRSADAARAMVRAIAAASDDDRIALEVRSADAAGATVASLRQRLGHGADLLQAALTRLVERGDLIRAGEGESAVYGHTEVVARLEKAATDALAAFVAAHPSARGMPKAELRERLPPSLPLRLFDELLSILIRRQAIEVERDVVRKPGGADGAASPLERRIAEAFETWGYTPERPKNVAETIGVDERAAAGAMDRLLTRGTLVKVRHDLFLHRTPLERLGAALIAHLEAHGEITPAQWKELTGTTRKFSIPLAEYFDKEKVTLRVGDVRKLRARPKT